MRGKIVSKKLQTFSPLPRAGKPFGKPYRVKKTGRVGVQRAVAKWTGDRSQGEEGEERGEVERNPQGCESTRRRAISEKFESGCFNKLLRVKYSHEKARIA